MTNSAPALSRAKSSASSTEQEIIDATVRFFLRQQNKHYKPGKKARRALHGKSLGTISGSFIVDELPPEFQVGIFKHPGRYEAVLRFSNGSLGPHAPDVLPNVRGASLKLYGVDQPNQLAEENFETGRAAECDFLFVNSPTFFVRDIGFIDAIMHKNLLRVFSYLPSLISNLVPAASRFVSNILEENYYTQVPHYFGDRNCKYALIAQSAFGKLANIFDIDYLRHGLERDLKDGSAKFDFCVQFKQPEDSLENLTKKWNGPWVTLATLTIDRCQTEIPEFEGEELSFNPARTPDEHRPAGWVGRMRKAVYKADFEWRRSKNSAHER